MTEKKSLKSPRQTSARPHGTTRDEIIATGLKLFSEKGFDGVSIKDIEAAVGLTPGRGSFYRHFESKEVLLQEVVRREVDKIRQLRHGQYRSKREALGDPRVELIEQYRQSLMGLDLMKGFINLLGREYGRFPELMQELYQSLVEESLAEESRDMQRDIDQKQVKGRDAEALAAVVQSALVGFHLSKTYFGNQPYGVDNDRFSKALAELLAISHHSG